MVLFSDDYHERAKKLLDDNLALEDVALNYGEIERFTTDDDVSRMLYFHLNAFRGKSAELGWIAVVLDLLGTLDRPKEVAIPFEPPQARQLGLVRGVDARGTLEKALHRAVLLGVVQDYTADYGGQMFTVRIDTVSAERTRRAVEDYVREYTAARSMEIRQRLDAIPSAPLRAFLESVASVLLDFVYGVIEKSRRKALREIWQWARQGHSDSKLRQELLNYLQETEHSRRIEELLKKDQIEVDKWRALADEAISVREVQELKGQVIRSLESTPDHPGLLYLRALCEALLPDGDPDEVASNFRASVRGMSTSYRPAFSNVTMAAWQVLESFDARAPRGIEPALGALEAEGLAPALARVCLKQANDRRILGRAAKWLLDDIVVPLERIA